MANGYLGKISAIVTANTGDFKPKLDAAASDVQRFARTVQSNLTSASSQASRAFEGIWTPLQKLERSLQAAGSMKLSFKGFEGALKDVDALKNRLALLGKRQIDISVTGTGFKTLADMREAIGKITSKDVGFVRNLGGLDSARGLRGAMNKGETEVLDKFSGVQSLAQIERALVVVGGNAEKAKQRMQQLVSAAKELAEPLAEASSQLSKMSSGIQASFGQALQRAQRGVENLKDDINAGATISEARYNGVARAVDGVTAAIRRMGEADAAAGKIATGSELRFKSPELATELERAASLQAEAMKISPMRGQQLNIGGSLAGVRAAAMEAAAAEARRSDAQLGGDPRRIAAANAEYQKKTQELRIQNNLLQLQTDYEAQLAREAAEAAKQEAKRAEAMGRGFTLGKSPAAARGLGLFGSEAGTADERALARAQELSAAYEKLPDSAQKALGRLAGIASNVANAVKDGTSNAAALNAVLDTLGEKIGEQRQSSLGSTGLITIPQPEPKTPRGLGLFGQENRTAEEQAISRAKRLSAEFAKLPESAQQGMAALARQASRLSNEVDQGKTKAESLNAVLDRIEGQMASQRDFIPLGSLEKSAAELKRIEAEMRKIKAAANFGGTLADAFEGSKIESYKARLSVLQRILIEAGINSGEAAEKVNEYAAALERASATKGGIAANANALAAAEAAARSAVAGAAGVSENRVGQALARAGSISSGAFSKLGLAAQQAAFAFEDFFSVTGGLDQRMRAAGNNLSQLGFILGGTTGLVLGISAAIGGQLVAAFMKWQNAGIGSEDATKALNDSLARQKSLVEDLAQSFASLADEISRLGMSKQGTEAAQFARQLDDIRKKQREFNQESAAAVDPAVQRERGIIAAAERKLEQTSDPGARVALNQQIRDARRREREAMAAAEATPGVTPEEAIRRAIMARARSEAAPLPEVDAGRRRILAEAEAEARAAVEDIGDLDSSDQFKAAQETIDREMRSIQSDIEQSQVFGADATPEGFIANKYRRERLAELEATRLSLEKAATAGANRLEVEVVEAAVKAARQIGVSQARVAAAIDAGVSGAVGLQSQLDTLDEALSDAVEEMTAAQERARESGSGGDLEAAEKAEERVRSIQADIDAREREAKAIDAARRAIEQFTAAFDRVRQEADRSFDESRTRAEQARGDDIERGTPGTRSARERAERDMERQESQRADVKREVALAEERARADEQVRANEARIAEIDAQLASSGVLAPGQREQLIAERESLRSDNDRRVRQTVDNDPAVRAARDAMDQDGRRREAANRGDQARMTPAERAGAELARGLEDIRQSFARDAEEGDGRIDFEGQRAAQQRLIEDSMRQTAPAIFGLADSVQNAILQGPSRAALQATDVSTVQGAAELNRLLRGDDSARNQDLVELQKQSRSLDELVRMARENGAAAGIFEM